MKYIGDPKYRGTLERAIALVLDANLIYMTKLTTSTPLYALWDQSKGMDGLVDKLVDASRRSYPARLHRKGAG